LAALGLGALVYGLIESAQVGFNDRSVIIALGAGIVVLILFLFVESRLSQPMLPLTLFRSRTFAGTNLLTFLLYAALGGTLFFLPLNLIQVQRYSPTSAGAALLPFILIMSFLSRWSGGLVARYGPKLPLVVGPVITAVGYLLFLLPGIGGNYWTNFFPPAVVLGLGMAITVAPLTTTVMGSIGQNRAGTASGVNNAVARTASLIAIAVLGVVMLHVFKTHLDHRLISANLPSSVVQSVQTQSTRLAAIDVPQNLNAETRQVIRRAIDESFVSGFRWVMVIGAALAGASAVTALFWIGGTTTAGSPFKAAGRYVKSYLGLNGPSKTLSESFRRSLGLSRACNFSGSNSFGPALPTAAIASTWNSSGIRSSFRARS